MQPPTGPDPVPDALSPPAADPAAALEIDAAGIQRGLLAWLGIVIVGGFGAVLMGHAEGAFLFAAAGAFALAQATDAAAVLERYRAFVRDQLPRGSAHGVLVRTIVRALVPLAGALFYVAFGFWAWRGDPEHAYVFAALWCAGATIVSLALAWRSVADAVTRACFGGTTGRTRRLTARLVVIALLMPVPASLVAPMLLDVLREAGTPLADAPGLVAQLLGEIAIALAGVGWLVRRGGRSTLERLGITAMRPAHWLVALAGFAGLVALNAGTEWVQHRWFPALWRHDHDVTQLIAGNLSIATSLLLGVSAGVGEEIAVRGALQPRLGILLSALLFASGHVQYTWYGMVTVAGLGICLGLVRDRTNTTTAIVVHAGYDIFAVLTSGQ